ncbi:plasmid partition protein ParG [Geminicoccus roseus]|uniref:plasmid partition protein ParG n=1 Tax=Geminicoccus roseus TaxID=404900 RepID=UPI000485F4D1|nr:plasmid partition protein ParG [Geminicoccus roseus]
MTKKIAFGPRPSASLPPSADSWVASRGGEPASAAIERPTMKRLTIDLPADVHARLKAQCAMRGTKMVDEIRRAVEDMLKS